MVSLVEVVQLEDRQSSVVPGPQVLGHYGEIEDGVLHMGHAIEVLPVEVRDGGHSVVLRLPSFLHHWLVCDCRIEPVEHFQFQWFCAVVAYGDGSLGNLALRTVDRQIDSSVDVVQLVWYIFPHNFLSCDRAS